MAASMSPSPTAVCAMSPQESRNRPGPQRLSPTTAATAGTTGEPHAHRDVASGCARRRRLPPRQTRPAHGGRDLSCCRSQWPAHRGHDPDITSAWRDGGRAPAAKSPRQSRQLHHELFSRHVQSDARAAANPIHVRERRRTGAVGRFVAGKETRSATSLSQRGEQSLDGDHHGVIARGTIVAGRKKGEFLEKLYSFPTVVLPQSPAQKRGHSTLLPGGRPSVAPGKESRKSGRSPLSISRPDLHQGCEAPQLHRPGEIAMTRFAV